MEQLTVLGDSHIAVQNLEAPVQLQRDPGYYSAKETMPSTLTQNVTTRLLLWSYGGEKRLNR
jgi:hypothetical protein